MAPDIVIDTNVIISALRSQRGASYKLLSLIDTKKYVANISVPLVYEYESKIREQIDWLGQNKIRDYINYICTVSRHQEIYYLWRPQLKDPKDEMVLELAIASGSRFIVTYNKKDFENVRFFGIQVVTAKEFLETIGELK